jgi:hypothetical protein
MKPGLCITFLLLLLVVPTHHLLAQADTVFIELPDSIREKEHSPTKATIMSTVLPGLGQAYNKKYWKIPIVYAGFGVLGYFIYFNADQYMTYKCAHIESSNGALNGNYSALVQRYTTEELLSAREYYRRNLEISCLLTAVWYALNILDATVDAHLYTYNITDRLTMNIRPDVVPTPYTYRPAPGIRLSFRF